MKFIVLVVAALGVAFGLIAMSGKGIGRAAPGAGRTRLQPGAPKDTVSMPLRIKRLAVCNPGSWNEAKRLTSDGLHTRLIATLSPVGHPRDLSMVAFTQGDLDGSLTRLLSVPHSSSPRTYKLSLCSAKLGDRHCHGKGSGSHLFASTSVTVQGGRFSVAGKSPGVRPGMEMANWRAEEEGLEVSLPGMAPEDCKPIANPVRTLTK